jgi:KDO2-lipid IV(A) lauroyltransferase
MRVKQGFHTIFRSRPGILKTIARGLKTGKFLVILPDVRMRTPGIELPFLGGTANLGPGTASFARITNAPIFCAIMHRVGWTHHTVKLLPVIRPDMSLDKQTDIKRMMSIIIEAFDREIREAPEQWFWFNKRWVLDPIDNDQLQQEKDKTND